MFWIKLEADPHHAAIVNHITGIKDGARMPVDLMNKDGCLLCSGLLIHHGSLCAQHFSFEFGDRGPGLDRLRLQGLDLPQ